MAYEAEGYAEVVDGVVVEVDRGVELGDLRENRGVRELASAVRALPTKPAATCCWCATAPIWPTSCWRAGSPCWRPLRGRAWMH